MGGRLDRAPSVLGQWLRYEIGREALFVAFGELGVDEVVAFTEPENVRSQAVMRRLEMDLVGDIDHGGERFVLYRSMSAR